MRKAATNEETLDRLGLLSLRKRKRIWKMRTLKEKLIGKRMKPRVLYNP